MKRGAKKRQFANSECTFGCGCRGVLPEQGQSNSFAYWRKSRWACRLYSNKSKKEGNKKKKIEIFSWYGTVCRCCGESIVDCLTLDHVHDDGKREFEGISCTRRRGKNNTGTGSKFYNRLVRAGYENRPLDLQVLCWNCQWGKQLNKGFCPHHPEVDLRIESYYYEVIMALKSLFTPAESGTLILAAMKLQQDNDSDAFLARLERVLLDKMFVNSETERLLGLSKSS